MVLLLLYNYYYHYHCYYHYYYGDAAAARLEVRQALKPAHVRLHKSPSHPARSSWTGRRSRDLSQTNHRPTEGVNQKERASDRQIAKKSLLKSLKSNLFLEPVLARIPLLWDGERSFVGHAARGRLARRLPERRRTARADICLCVVCSMCIYIYIYIYVYIYIYIYTHTHVYIYIHIYIYMIIYYFDYVLYILILLRITLLICIILILLVVVLWLCLLLLLRRVS